MGQGADHIGQVLVQGAPELHVEHLAAAADGQDGQVRPQGGGQQGAFAGVAVGVDPTHLGFGLLAVGPGVDVAATAEHQAVEDGDDLVGTPTRAFGRAARWRHQQRAATGGGHQLEVVLGQDGRPARPGGPARLGHVGGDADQGDHRGQRTERGWTLARSATNMAPHARPRAHRPRNRRRVGGHRHRCLPRHVRAPGGQAGHGRLLVLPRGRPRDRGLRVPPRRRRRHEPAARLHLRQLGHRLRRRRVRPRLRHGPAHPVARGHGHGHLRSDRPRRRAGRGLAPPDAAPPAGAGGRAGAARLQRHRARVLPLHGHLRGGGGQALARPDAAHLDDRGLPTAPDGARGVHLAADPQRDDRRRHPGGVLQGRGRARASTR